MKIRLFIGMGNYLVQRPTPNPDNSQDFVEGEPNFLGGDLLVCLFGRPMKMDTMIWCKSWNAFGSRIKSALAKRHLSSPTWGCCPGMLRRKKEDGTGWI